MSRGGGWRGGRGGQGGGSSEGSGGGSKGGGSNRNEGRRPAPAPVRFPSDHAGRSEGPTMLRYPSDSVKGKHDFAQGGRDTTPPGRTPARRPNEGSSHRSDAPRNDAHRPHAPRSEPHRDSDRQGRSFGSKDARRYSRQGRGRGPAGPRDNNTLFDASFLEIARVEGDVSHLDPFELFCAYHLGLGRDGSVRPTSLPDTARRFNIAPGLAKHALFQYAMDPESLTTAAYDMELARMDIQVSPPGISKRELARSLYQDFVEALGERCTWESFARKAPGTSAPLASTPDLAESDPGLE